MAWIDNLPPGERAVLRDAGRLGNTRFEGPAIPSVKRRLMALFQGDGTQTHYELVSYRGGRHVVSAVNAAEILLADVLADYEAALDALQAMLLDICPLDPCDNPLHQRAGEAVARLRGEK